MLAGRKNVTYPSAGLWNAIVSKININVLLSQFKVILKIYLLHIHLFTTIPNKLNNLIKTLSIVDQLFLSNIKAYMYLWLGGSGACPLRTFF